MALYIPHSIFHLARLLYVRPETFGPYYVHFISGQRYSLRNCAVCFDLQVMVEVQKPYILNKVYLLVICDAAYLFSYLWFI